MAITTPLVVGTVTVEKIESNDNDDVLALLASPGVVDYVVSWEVNRPEVGSVDGISVTRWHSTTCDLTVHLSSLDITGDLVAGLARATGRPVTLTPSAE